MKNAIVILYLFTFSMELALADWKPDRRRDQFPKEDAYLVVPLPYSYPGLGEGFWLIGNASNIFNTTTDAFLLEIIGDLTGRVAQIDEIPILADQLFLSVGVQDINRATSSSYAIRGMDGSDGDDYIQLDISQADSTTFRLDYTLDNRRLNLYIARTDSAFALDAILDSDGDLIQTLSPSYKGKETKNLIAFSLDYTDDYLDPRKGFRFGLEYIDDPAKNADSDPKYYVLNYNFLYYHPMRLTDTLVINYFQSDAHVRSIGNTDAAAIRGELNLNCGVDSVCLQREQELVNNFINSRTNGTATSLGGLERLRSYPNVRFEGGHTAFLGVEYRWNLTEEATPFNYFFWKDVRTGKQIAFFAEAGSVSEKSSDIWDEKRFSYGVGYRILAASGSVYRADLAVGDEGAEVAVFFFYPWR